MSNPMIRIHNVETDEIIDREMNADELSQHNKDLLDWAHAKDLVDQAAADKQILLDRLDITAREAALLLS